MLGAGAAALVSTAAAGTRRTSNPLDRTRSVIGAMVRDHGFQGVILLGRRGVPRFAQAIGAADIAAGTALTVHTPFGIASISKRLTTVAIMRLVQRGRLSLDAPITTYLGDYRTDTGARIKLRHLLSNSSGVPNLFSPAVRADASLVRREMPASEAIRRFASGDLVFEPGTRFDYTPTNWFIVLGIIEAVTGMSYAEAMRRLVTEPLDLNTTTPLAPATMAKSYRSISPVAEWTDGHPAYRAASGGFVSTAHDLLRFAHKVYDTSFLSHASRTALTTIEVPSDSYALGGRVREVSLGDSKVAAAWETGNIAGFRSVLGHRLDGKGSVVLLNNTALSQRTMDEFADALLRSA